MFVFQYMLTEDDYVAFNDYHMAYSPAAKTNRRILRLLAPALFLLCFLVLSRIIDSPLILAVEGAVFLIISILWIVFFRRFYRRSIRAQVKRLGKIGKLPFNREVTLCFEDHFFTETSPDSESKMSYTKIERIMVGKYILIYIGSIQAIILPAYAFQNKEQWDAFFIFLQSKTTAPVISIPE